MLMTENNLWFYQQLMAAMRDAIVEMGESADKINPLSPVDLVIDHSVMENLHHFDDDYTRAGGTVEFLGLDQLKPVSAHPLAARKRSKAF